MMRVLWGRIVIAAVMAEIVAIVTLVLIVALFGPTNRDEIQGFAEKTGAWVGPIGGAIFCFFGGFWVTRSSRNSMLVHGLLVGIATAVFDVLLLFLAQAPFQFLFVASNLAKILAGTAGGYVAAHLEPRTPQIDSTKV